MTHGGHFSVDIVIDQYVNRVPVDMSTEGCTNYARSRNCQSVNKSVHSNLGIKAELGIIYFRI